MNQERIGKFISLCRNKKSLTQSELAYKLGITDKAISKWENGRCLPDLVLIKPLCKELGITMNELLSGDYIKENELKKKSEIIIDKTITYMDVKERKTKKIIYLFLIIILSTFIIIGITNIKNYAKQNYYALENSNIMYEEYLNNIKYKMDEICDKDENGNWIKIKNSDKLPEYDNKRNELVKDIQESYNYLIENKNINFIKSYQTKGQVTKKELEYLNSINDSLTCLNNFSKYKELINSKNEVDIKIYEEVKDIYILQSTEIYKKSNLTFAEINSKLIFEASAINHLSSYLYREYYNEYIK